MIEQARLKLTVGAQCRPIYVSRWSFYYEPQGEAAMDLHLMPLIDQQFLEDPFYGGHQMTWRLQNEGYHVNLKRISRRMRRA